MSKGISRYEEESRSFLATNEVILRHFSRGCIMDMSNVPAKQGDNGVSTKAKLQKVGNIEEFVRRYGGPSPKSPEKNPRQTEDLNAFVNPTAKPVPSKQIDKKWSLGCYPRFFDNIALDPSRRTYGPREMSKDFNFKQDFFIGSSNKYFDKIYSANQKPLAVSVTEDGKWGRYVNAIKSQSLLREKECHDFVRQVRLRSSQYKSVVTEKEVNEAVELFHEIVNKVLQESEADSRGRKWVLLQQAAVILQKQNKWINTCKILGPVPGVEVGDRFQCRAELVVIGLHQLFYDGIDHMEKDGKILAASIVDSGRYDNNKKSTDVLIYSGHGGNPAIVGKKRPRNDQKLKRGNLSLKNSMESRTPVRVIRGYNSLEVDNYVGISGQRISKMTYIYDGLYLVDMYHRERSETGKIVYKFTLKRIPGQPEVSWHKVNRSKKSDMPIKYDLSLGKEKMPICAVDATCDRKPASFNYITDMIYPDLNSHSFPMGCNCTDGCNDFKKCSCAIKNGGQIVYTNDGCIVKPKPFIYECGPLCKCSACINRLSQQGIRFQLEVFRTESKRWGVRSLSHIPSGMFICEYTGEVFPENEVQPANGIAKYVFYIGKSSSCSSEDNVRFVIDAANFGNVGRFINRSSSPNVYAQKVLYDHDDKRMPHIMFFVLKDILPLQEITRKHAVVKRRK